MAVGFPAGPQKLLHLSILLVPSLHIVFKEKRVLTSQLDSEALERDLPCGAQDSARRWAWRVFPLPILLGDCHSQEDRKTSPKHLQSQNEPQIPWQVFSQMGVESFSESEHCCPTTA